MTFLNCPWPSFYGNKKSNPKFKHTDNPLPPPSFVCPKCNGALICVNCDHRCTTTSSKPSAFKPANKSTSISQSKVTSPTSVNRLPTKADRISWANRQPTAAEQEALNAKSRLRQAEEYGELVANDTTAAVGPGDLVSSEQRTWDKDMLPGNPLVGDYHGIDKKMEREREREGERRERVARMIYIGEDTSKFGA